MLELLFTLASILAGFATGVAVPATYLGIPYLSGDAAYYVSLLVAYGILVWGAYAISNLLDAVTPQTSWALYRLSFVSSWFAWVGINITAAIVFYQLISGGHLRQLSDITGSLQFLLALMAYSWFDVLYLQRRKYAVLLAGRGGAAVPPAPPPIAPARTDNWGGALTAILLFVIVGAVLMFAFGVKVPAGKVFASRDTVTVTVPPASKPEIPPAEKKSAGKGRVTQTLEEWAKLTDACLAERNVLSTSHAVRGCFSGEDGQVHCTHDTFEDIADECRTKANASGRPKGVFN